MPQRPFASPAFRRLAQTFIPELATAGEGVWAALTIMALADRVADGILSDLTGVSG